MPRFLLPLSMSMMPTFRTRPVLALLVFFPVVASATAAPPAASSGQEPGQALAASKGLPASLAAAPAPGLPLPGRLAGAPAPGMPPAKPAAVGFLRGAAEAPAAPASGRRAVLSQAVQTMGDIVDEFLRREKAPGGPRPSTEEAVGLLAELSRDLRSLHHAMRPEGHPHAAGNAATGHQPEPTNAAGAPCKAEAEKLTQALAENERLLAAYTATASSAEQALKSSSACAETMKEARATPGGMPALVSRREAEKADATSKALAEQVSQLQGQLQGAEQENHVLNKERDAAIREVSQMKAEIAELRKSSEKRLQESRNIVHNMAQVVGSHQLKVLTQQNQAQQRAIDNLEHEYAQKGKKVSQEEAALKVRLQETKDAAKLFVTNLATSDQKLREENKELHEAVRILQKRTTDLKSDKDQLMAAINRGLMVGNRTSDDDTSEAIGAALQASAADESRPRQRQPVESSAAPPECSPCHCPQNAEIPLDPRISAEADAQAALNDVEADSSELRQALMDSGPRQYVTWTPAMETTPAPQDRSGSQQLQAALKATHATALAKWFGGMSPQGGGARSRLEFETFDKMKAYHDVGSHSETADSATPRQPAQPPVPRLLPPDATTAGASRLLAHAAEFGLD